MTGTHRFSVSVAAAVIREDGKILAIQRRDNHHWEPPGGVLEAGETLRDGLVREVQEETGYTVIPGPLTGVYQNMARDIIALVFRCTTEAGSPRTSDESYRVQWLSADEVRERMSEAYAVRLFDALTPVDGPKTRAHDGQNVVARDGMQRPPGTVAPRE